MAFWEVTLRGLVGGGLGSTLVGALLQRRNALIAEQMRADFANLLNRSSSQRLYQEKALEELFGPAKMQLARTGRAFQRWRKPSEHIETKIIREANLFLRDLFLCKGHLFPPHLFEDADLLIEHFDAWLEEYEKVRVNKTEGEVDRVFVGPKGFPFPRTAERRILDYAVELQRALYGEVMRAS